MCSPLLLSSSHPVIMPCPIIIHSCGESSGSGPDHQHADTDANRRRRWYPSPPSPPPPPLLLLAKQTDIRTPPLPRIRRRNPRRCEYPVESQLANVVCWCWWSLSPIKCPMKRAAACSIVNHIHKPPTTHTLHSTVRPEHTLEPR